MPMQIANILSQFVLSDMFPVKINASIELENMSLPALSYCTFFDLLLTLIFWILNSYFLWDL
jgi:hypothetical protein